MFAQYILTRPILDLCERATQRMGARVYQRWWEKEGRDLEAAKERGGKEGAGKLLQGGGAGGATVWGGDVGAYPKDRAGAGELHAWGHASDNRKTDAERGDGQWKYPPLKEALREAGCEGIWKAAPRRHNTVAQYIVTRPILYLCQRATQRLGARVYRKWCKQEGIDLEAAKERAAEAIATDSESESDSESEAESEEGWEGISASSGVSGSSGAERSEDPWRTKGHTNGTFRKFTK